MRKTIFLILSLACTLSAVFFAACKDGGDNSSVNSAQQEVCQHTFADGTTPEQKFDAAVGHLLTGHKGEFVRYRKLVW